MARVALTLILAFAFDIATAHAQQSSSLDTQIAVLQSAARGALARHGAEGAAVALVSGGAVVWSEGFGVADATTGAPVTADTVFEAASVAKPVAAWAILRLADEGRLDLDAPIQTYISGWALPHSEFDRAKVTARRLLAHAAGISFGGDPGVEPGQDVPSLLDAADGEGMEGGGIRVAYRPGEAYRYSSKGYLLLELAVENITGEPFAEYAKREILEPLGMSSSAFRWSPDLRARAATGHDWFGNPLPRYEHATSAPGGLVTTAGDLARFLAAAMPGPGGEAPGRGVISPGSVGTSLTPYPFDNDTSLVGLGYNLDVSNGVRVARKSGDHRGFKPIVFSIPELGAGLVILTNSDRAAAGVFADTACPWSETLQGHPLRSICGQLYTLRNAHWAIAACIWAIALALSVGPVRGLAKGTRKVTAGISFRRGIAAGILLAILIAWWVFWYSDLALRLLGYPKTFVTVRFDPWPTAFIWISIAVTSLLAIMLLRIFARRREDGK